MVLSRERIQQQERRIEALFTEIAPQYDRANDRISLTLHRRWKDRLCRDLAAGLPQGGRLLDVCCGTGDIALHMAALRPDVSVTGLDLTAGMLEVARQRAKTVDNITFLKGDAMALRFAENSFDAVTVGFGLRNTPDVCAALAEIARVTRRGGRIAILESSTPSSKIIRLGYRIYFSTVMPLLGGGLKHYEAYRWLHTSTWSFPEKKELADMMARSGFQNNQYRSLLWGCAAIHTGTKT